MAKHRAAGLPFGADITGMFAALVVAELAVGTQRKDGGHGKNGVEGTEWTEVTAPDIAVEKKTEEQGAAGNGKENSGGQQGMSGAVLQMVNHGE